MRCLIRVDMSRDNEGFYWRVVCEDGKEYFGADVEIQAPSRTFYDNSRYRWIETDAEKVIEGENKVLFLIW